MPSLRVLNGAEKGRVYQIDGGEFVGRDPANAIPIPSPKVSRKHCQLSVENGAAFVTDLGSVNGTFVNDERIEGKLELKEDDTIAVGDVIMRFSSKDAPPSDAPPAEKIPSAVAKRPTVARPARPLGADTEGQITVPAERDAGGRTIVFSDAHDKNASNISVDASMIFTTTDLKLPTAQQVAALQKRLSMMFEVTQALGAIKDRDELLGKILDQLFATFPQAGRGFILVGSKPEELEPAIVRNRGKGGASAKGITISRTIATKVFAEKHAILSYNAAEDFSGATSLASLEIHSLMVAPLLFRGDVSGFIQLDTQDAKRKFTPDDLNLLAGLASSAAIFMKNLSLFESIAKEVKEREAIQSELRLAHQIQAALLPKRTPDVPALEIAARMKTAKEVGGDLYDYIPAGPEGDGARDVFVVIGDVSGKGVPAGLVMVMARSILRSLAAVPDMSPREAVIEANRILKADLKPGMFMSLLLVRCDARAGTLRIAGCGHERPILFRAKTQKVEQLDLGGLVLGVVADNTKHVTEVEVKLAPGDQLVLYTDGVPEAMDAGGKQYTMERLEKTVARAGPLAPPDVIGAIEQDVARHASGADQHDDITLIAIRRRPS